MKLKITAAILAACLCMTGCMAAKTKLERKEEDAAPAATPVQTAPQPAQTPQQISFVKSAFLDRAAEIEAYDTAQLQNARSQMDLNREAGIVYERWDTLLNDIWKYLKETLPEAEYEALLEEQLAWIADKEAAMAAVSADWQGGTGEPMARFGEGSAYTSKRCYELIELI